ncbi:MAG: 16S rRNA (uracil(1498)-N(3))-methyltransferase [Cocleimonas sp.]
MRIPRFYQEINVELGQTQVLSGVNHRHAVQVLRLKLDDVLILFDGKGGEYIAKINVANKRDSAALLESFTDIDRESSLKSILILSTIKSDKMDFAIQKAVELGVTSIQPMISHRSVIKIKADRLQKKMQHWQAIIIGACEQSGRTQIPLLEAPLSLGACLDKYKAVFCIGMLPTSLEKFSDLALDNNEQNVALFIGPEGGFTDEEEALMQSYEINTVNFGSRILRAETAVIAGITACQQQWGDL